MRPSRILVPVKVHTFTGWPEGIPVRVIDDLFRDGNLRCRNVVKRDLDLVDEYHPETEGSTQKLLIFNGNICVVTNNAFFKVVYSKFVK